MKGVGGIRLPADHPERERLAGATDTNFAVGAGAGSGKTRILVDRITGLIDRGVDLDRIVAITFTEKAASELRERVREVLTGDSEDHSAEVETFRKVALGKVDLSQLTTIHSFCRSILATRPLEAGISPGFSVLDELESNLLLSAVASEEIKKLRETEDNDIEGVLLAGGRLADLLGLVQAIRRYPDLEVEFPHKGDESISDVIEALLDTARTIVSFKDLVPEADGLLQQAIKLLDRAPYMCGKAEDVYSRAAVLDRIKIHRNIGAKDKWNATEETRAAFETLKPAWRALADRRKKAIAGFKSEQLTCMIERAQKIIEIYAARKAELGALDFDDLLIKTRDLLESEREVSEQIKNTFDYILVDEFQDTDPVQARIVLRLAEGAGKRAGQAEEAIPSPGRLFLVGDANQSIYRFRRADLSVFKQARHQLLKSGEEGRLGTNFRSSPELVTIANHIFPELLGGSEYRALDPFRNRDGEGSAVTLLDLDPLLEDMMRDDPEGSKPGREVVRIAEARALAGWIIQQMKSGRAVSARDCEEWRELTYSDIAILVRTYTGVDVFERELERCGIPYRISGGRTFFQRLEILQTLPVLRAIADPGDKVAVVAALRSPYFGVSDESLVRWVAGGTAFTYLDFREPGEGDTSEQTFFDEEVDRPLFKACNILAGLYRDSSHLSPSALLRQLYDRTRAVPLHALKPDGDRRLANLLKLLDLVTAYEEAAIGLTDSGSEEIGTLNGLVSYLEEQQRAAVEEESALVDEEGDAVTLMTIHSAKGLEFPVVAILDRDYRSSVRDAAIPLRDKGMVAVKSGRLKPLNWDDYEATEKVEQQQEARRLLYVAFTRARDHVVTCGRRSTRPEEKAFLAPLENVLRELADKSSDWEADLVEWVTPPEPELHDTLPHRLPSGLDEPSPDVIDVAVRKRTEESNDWLEAVRRAHRQPVMRASWIPRISEMTGEAMPSGEFETGAMVDITGTRWYARLRGIRVHTAMELVTGYREEPAKACHIVGEPGDPSELVEEVCTLVGKGVELLDQSLSEGWNVVAAEWPLLLGSAQGALSELLGEEVDVLTGTVDLIMADPDGNLLVVDYKTGRMSAEFMREKYGGQLHAYRVMLEISTGCSVSSEIWDLHGGERLPLA